MSDTKTYTGSCHCGKIRYEVTTNLAQTITCNCSICARRGWILTFVGADAFKPLSGTEEQSLYQFGKKSLEHLFCPVCGVSSFGTGKGQDGKTMYAINVRCLAGVDVNALKPLACDGASL
jgi:hypothetical protein